MKFLIIMLGYCWWDADVVKDFDRERVKRDKVLVTSLLERVQENVLSRFLQNMVILMADPFSICTKRQRLTHGPTKELLNSTVRLITP